MKEKITLFLVVVCNFVFAQEDTTSIYLHSWKDSSKVYRMKFNNQLFVSTIEMDTFGFNNVSLDYTGRFASSKNNKLEVILTSTSFEREINGGKQHVSVFNFSDKKKNAPDLNYKQVAFSDIKTISRENNWRTEDAIYSFSVLTGLLVAPLVSINYKTGNFNEKIYYPILISSAVIFGFNWIISARNEGRKTFHIKQIKPSDDKDYYWITTERSKYIKRIPKDNLKRARVAF